MPHFAGVTVDCPHPWYALRVKPNFERSVAMHLDGRGLKAFLPTYHDRRVWSDRVKDIQHPLFDGYVFASFDVHDNSQRVLTIPGIVGIVSFGRQATAVDPAELAAVRSVVESGVLAKPFPFLCVGDKVMVRRGPLAGVEGILTRVKGECRLVVSVSLLARSVSVELDADWVRPTVHSIPLPGEVRQPHQPR